MLAVYTYGDPNTIGNAFTHRKYSRNSSILCISSEKKVWVCARCRLQCTLMHFLSHALSTYIIYAKCWQTSYAVGVGVSKYYRFPIIIFLFRFSTTKIKIKSKTNNDEMKFMYIAAIIRQRWRRDFSVCPWWCWSHHFLFTICCAMIKRQTLPYGKLWASGRRVLHLR